MTLKVGDRVRVDRVSDPIAYAGQVGRRGVVDMVMGERIHLTCNVFRSDYAYGWYGRDELTLIEEAKP